MGRKQLKRETAAKQELADQMLCQSKNDLARVRSLKEYVSSTIDRVAELNRENNFSRRIEAAYAGKGNQ